MALELHPATWEGPYPAETLDGRTLMPGDEAMVTEADLESGHWRGKDEPKPRRSSQGKRRAKAKQPAEPEQPDAAGETDTEASASETPGGES